MYHAPLAKGSAGGRLYLSVVAVLTLLLLAWHYSIQAAAHDAAIAQVRTWLQGMGASAGKVQFRLLRGALTIENVNADIQGNPLSIRTLFIQGNPASITTQQPKIQVVRIQGMSLEVSQMSEQWQNLNVATPQALQSLFRYAKTIHVQDSIISQPRQNIQIDLQALHISGSAEQRDLFGQGTFQQHNDAGIWHIESFIPSNTSLQTGEIIAQSDNGKRSLNWAGAWQHENMTIHFQHQTSSGGTLAIKLQQDKQQWKGDIQAQSWAIKTSAFKSLVSGALQFSGTTESWQVKSNKLLWQHTVIQQHQTSIQSMTSHQLHINQTQKTIQMSRLDIEDVNMSISTTKSLIQPAWQWDIASINIEGLFISLGQNDENIHFPSMHGTASVQKNKLQLDISQQVDENQFWRIQSKGNGSLYLSASHVPLIQIRNLLPNPIRNQSYTIDGTAWLQLHSTPSQQWKTSGKVYVSDMMLGSKNQSFSADKVELTIEDADISGIKQANLRVDRWTMQLPMTPQQAWSNTSHLEAWASIPWSFQDIRFNQGKVVIGSHENTWLSQADLHIKHWQSDKPALFTLKAQLGDAPLSVDMKLRQEEGIMQWQSIHMDIQHANLFFLKDWLTLSKLPYISRGHGSLILDVKQQDGLTQGDVDLKLLRLQLLSKHQPNFLENTLQLSNNEITVLAQHIKASFQGTSDTAWSTMASLALMQQIKAQKKTIQQVATIQRNIQLLGSLRIQQDIRLSLNERTRLRRIIKAIKQHKHAIIELTPDIGTAELTPAFRQQIMQTQAVIKSFMGRRGIRRENIYFIIPQEKHQSMSDISAVHINLIE